MSEPKDTKTEISRLKYELLEGAKLIREGMEIVASLQLQLEKAEAQRDRLASDALVALAGSKICTPARGFVEEPFMLAACIEDLCRERDRARKGRSAERPFTLRVLAILDRADRMARDREIDYVDSMYLLISMLDPNESSGCYAVQAIDGIVGAVTMAQIRKHANSLAELVITGIKPSEEKPNA